jgi:hypothetical protein
VALLAALPFAPHLIPLNLVVFAGFTGPALFYSLLPLLACFLLVRPIFFIDGH